MIDLPKLTLVLGGAASGKSAYAESLCFQSGLQRTYLATAQAWDDEMRAKVAAHRTQRGENWTTIEEPVDIAPHLLTAHSEQVVLLDCATLWLTNLLLSDADVDSAMDTLRGAVGKTAAKVIIVSNEVGHGIVPDNALSRRFQTVQGRMNQTLAQDADTVVAVMAGLPMALKGALA